MFDSDRAGAVRRLVTSYLRSPSVSHMRDPHSIDQLVEQILGAIDREPSVWRKWLGERETFLEAAAPYWLPLEDLRDFLNGLPGPPLTLTDVEQRVRAINEAPFTSRRDEELRPGCEALYAREKAEGTELAAIVGALEDFVYFEGLKLEAARADARRQRIEDERLALEQRFLSGADCKWTAIQRSPELYTRINGRAYRLNPTKDKRWELYRIQSVEDCGTRIGLYGSRGDVNKVLAKLAYDPEPRW
jgi:hypothetical protein